MATNKPTAKKKTTARKAAPKKKPATRKTATKKTSARSRKPEYQTFRVARPSTPFLTIAITRQTFYWAIMGIAVLLLGFWVIHLQNKVNDIYDTIDANNLSSSQSQLKIEKMNKEATKH